jgi:predicted ATPase
MKKLTIKNFKSFENEDIYFEKLTVLTGGNGVGKSTVIQSLLILLQSFNKKDAGIIPNRYYLNDYYV